jgi:hypothetical protein
MKTFAILLMFLLTGQQMQQAIVNTKPPVVASCTAPTTTNRWAAFNPANDCGGTCTNGSAMNTMADLSGSNTATAQSAPTFAKPVYNTGLVNGLPGVTFTQTNNDWFSLGSGLANTGSITLYMVFSTTNSSSTQDFASPQTGNGLEWYVASGAVHANAKTFSVIANGGGVSNNTWTAQAITANFAGTVTLYSCSAGACTSTGSGTWSLGTQSAINAFGGNNAFFSGAIAELGYRNSITSMSDIATYVQCKYGI